MKTQQELDDEHHVRVQAWVTVALILAVIGTLFFPNHTLWLGFGSNLFWIWRK